MKFLVSVVMLFLLAIPAPLFAVNVESFSIYGININSSNEEIRHLGARSTEQTLYRYDREGRIKKFVYKNANFYFFDKKLFLMNNKSISNKTQRKRVKEFTDKFGEATVSKIESEEASLCWGDCDEAGNCRGYNYDRDKVICAAADIYDDGETYFYITNLDINRKVRNYDYEMSHNEEEKNKSTENAKKVLKRIYYTLGVSDVCGGIPPNEVSELEKAAISLKVTKDISNDDFFQLTRNERAEGQQDARKTNCNKYIKEAIRKFRNSFFD